jgi:general secretion pathway protein D
MKAAFFAFLLFCSTVSMALDDRSKQPAKFDFQAVSVSQIIGLVYLDALQQPYVIDPSILKDDRAVSFRFDSAKGDFRQFWRAFLESLGFVVETRGGVDFVSVKKPDSLVAPTYEVFVYRPRYRSLPYLVDVLGSVFRQGAFSIQRNLKTQPGDVSPSNVSPSSAAGQIQSESDTMIFQGSADDVLKLKRLLTQVDVAAGEVVVSAIVYEVTTGQSDVTAYSLALSLLGGKLGATMGGGVGVLANAVTFKNSNIEMAFSALSGDSRFKAVSTPRLRVKSGAVARLIVGQEVPVLGAVSYPQAGAAPVQSVEYRSSGVILGLSPVIRDAGVDLVVDQQISDFVKTETGVNNSPTLIKRALSTTVLVSDGELIVLGGLTQDKVSTGSSGPSFLPSIFRSSNFSDSKTEVLLLMQVQRI